MISQYEDWAMRRLRKAVPCRVEPQMHCVPLRGDPICRACYEIDVQEGVDTDEANDD